MLINARSGQSIASSVEIATTRTQRRRGLLGRDGLPPARRSCSRPAGPCTPSACGFAIDVIFIDDEGES